MLNYSNCARVSPQALESFCVAACVKAGMREAHAKLIADVLVTTDTWGVYTHGSYRLAEYVQRCLAGGFDLQAEPEILAEGPGWVTIDGHSVHSMVSAHLAMEFAIEKAATVGIAFASVKNCYHFGAAAYFANMAVKRDQIGLAMSNVGPFMSVPGSSWRVIGNNPFSYAAPAGQERPVFLDIAMSVVAAAKIEIAKWRGEPVPDGWMVDEEGVPTTDSNKYPDTMSLLPMGGHKGYGLAVMVEILSAVLTGAGITTEVISQGIGPADRRNSGHSFIAINIGAMMPVPQFKDRMDRMIRRVRESPKAKGAERIYLPGEMEWEKRDEALKYGIPLPEATIAALTTVATTLDLNVQDLFR